MQQKEPTTAKAKLARQFEWSYAEIDHRLVACC
jgi:hypothetical protein